MVFTARRERMRTLRDLRDAQPPEAQQRIDVILPQLDRVGRVAASLAVIAETSLKMVAMRSVCPGLTSCRARARFASSPASPATSSDASGRT